MQVMSLCIKKAEVSRLKAEMMKNHMMQAILFFEATLKFFFEG